MNISKSEIKDAPELTRLINSAYRGEEAKKGWTHEAELISGNTRTNDQAIMELMAKPGAVILKCTDEKNKIIGCVYLERKKDHLYLGMLSVSPDLQAKGIGKRLLSAANDYAQKHSCAQIEMTVISVRRELIAWYTRNGYVDTGNTEPFPQDERFGRPVKPIEFIVMKKQLLTSEG